MIEKKCNFSTDRSVLDQLLEQRKLTNKDFAKMLGIQYRSFMRYREGNREFRLNTNQMKIFDNFLREMGLSLSDLPDDWIQDKRELEGRKAS